MNILVFGATGRVGSKLVQYCQEESHTVSVFVRSGGMVSGAINTFQGDVKDFSEVAKACQGQDVILSALSGRSTKPDYSVLSIAVENYLQAAKIHSIKRIFIVGGAGILKDMEFGQRRNRPNYPAFFQIVSQENLKVLESLQNSTLNWTMVAAPEMPEGERTGKYRTEIDYLPENGNRISVEDVADFIVKNISNSDYYQKLVGIAYPSPFVC